MRNEIVQPRSLGDALGARCHVKPENIVIAPDCGMKYLPRDVAFGKMRAMVEAAKILRREFAKNQ